VPFSTNVPEFSFVSVTEDEVYNAVMSIKSIACFVRYVDSRFQSHLYLFGISGKVGGPLWCCQFQKLLSP
jgi:hypothetical protein